MNNQNRPSVGRICLPVIAYFGITLCVQFFLAQISFVYSVVNYNGEGFSELLSNYMRSIQTDGFYNAMGLLNALIMLPLFIFWYKRDVLDPANIKIGSLFAMHKKLNYKTFFVILLVLVGMIVISTYILNGFAMASPSTYADYMKLMEQAEIGDFKPANALYYLFIVFSGPIVEELCFRGLIFGYLEKHMNFWVANTLQAFLFGFCHGNIIQGVYAFILGFCLGYIYFKMENILIPIILHCLFNITGSATVEIPGDDNVFVYLIILAAGLCALYFGLYFSSKSKKA